MNKKGIIIGGIALLAIIGIGGGLLFGSRIRAALSMAKSATLNEESIKAREEENARTQEEIQQRFNLAELTPDADLSSALQDGSMTLEEAAALLLEQSGMAAEPAGSVPEKSGTVSENAETVGGDQQRPDESGMGTAAQSGGASNSTGTAAQNGGTSNSTDTAQSGGASSSTDTAAQSGGTSSSTDTAAQNGGASDGTETAAQSGGASSGTDTAAQSGGESGGTDTAQEPQQTAEPAPPEESEEEKRLKNLMAQMVLLRGTFNAKVDEFVSACIAEFMALPEEERTTANKMRIGYSKLEEVAVMEEECDNQVAAIVSQIREIDSDLADQVQKQYQNEKELKKASLIAQYT